MMFFVISYIVFVVLLISMIFGWFFERKRVNTYRSLYEEAITYLKSSTAELSHSYDLRDNLRNELTNAQAHAIRIEARLTRLIDIINELAPPDVRKDSDEILSRNIEL